MAKRTARPSVSDEDAFLAAIAAAPDDDLPRLVYCDWLDENGRSGQANFIRWQLRNPEYDRPTFTVRLGASRPRGVRATPGYHANAVKLLDCIAHPVWGEQRFHGIHVGGRSVAVTNKSKSCGVVWRRGLIAAVWASYVSFTPEVVRQLQKCPLEIFHYYGDVPGTSRVIFTDAGPAITSALVQYHWCGFKIAAGFRYAGEVYEFGGLNYDGGFRFALNDTLDECLHAALKHHFPSLRGLRVGRPNEADFRAYNRHFYPGAGCPPPFDPPGSVADRESVRRLTPPAEPPAPTT